MASKRVVVPIRPARPERVVTDTVAFEVGGTRFAFDWEIRPLPSAPAQVIAPPRSRFKSAAKKAAQARPAIAARQYKRVQKRSSK